MSTLGYRNRCVGVLELVKLWRYSIRKGHISQMQLFHRSGGIFVLLQRGGTKESIGRGKFYLSKQERHVVSALA